jgi:hypothetical protein
MGAKKMFKKSLILMSMVLVLLGSIAVAIVENSKTSASDHTIPVVTPPDVGTGLLGDITIQGTAINNFSRIGAWGWNVYVNKVVDGPAEVKNKSMSVYLTSADPAKYPRGFIDPNIRPGDRVEAYGDYSSGSSNILLTGSTNYYLKRVSMIGTPKQRR